jgi:hypothetical protein
MEQEILINGFKYRNTCTLIMPNMNSSCDTSPMSVNWIERVGMKNHRKKTTVSFGYVNASLDMSMLGLRYIYSVQAGSCKFVKISGFLCICFFSMPFHTLMVLKI